MPVRDKTILNAFTAQQVEEITELSVYMTNYLVRTGYLQPTYQRGSVRGKIRYFSYRDLVIARIVQRLCEAGVELKRLKDAIQLLGSNETWFAGPKERSITFLATDGKKIYYPSDNGSLVEATKSGQRSFAFVLNVKRAKDDVKKNLKPSQLKFFDLRNGPLLRAKKRT